MSQRFLTPFFLSHLERFFRSLKSEALERRIFFSEASLRRTTLAYLDFYHGERNHQGLGNRLIEPGAEVGRTAGTVVYRERVGSLLRYYYRAAA